MTKKNIFSFNDYKTYLSSVEQQGEIKGFRSRLAEATDCQNAFVSQVLNGDVNFSLEQGLKIAAFLGLRTDEHQYFLWMIEYRRAGTADLKKYFQQLMAALREKNLEIKDRVAIPQVLSAEAQATYYSSWIYSAIHVLAMIPSFNTSAKIASALGLSTAAAETAVDFLVNNGLLNRTAGHLSSGKIQIHLGRDSANINKHHGNWRIEALKSLDHSQKGDLHYSGVSSLSRADVEKIREMFVDLIENYVRVVEKSPEETLYAFNLDFFQMLRT